MPKCINFTSLVFALFLFVFMMGKGVADNLSVSATASPTTGLNPLTVAFSGTSSGCGISNSATVQVSGIPFFGGFFNTVTLTIQNNLSTPLTIWRVNVVLAQANTSWGTLTLGGRTADAAVPQSYSSNTTNYDYYFNQSGNPTSNQPVVNPYVIPAGGNAQMQLFFIFPIGGTSDSIQVNFYDPNGNLPGSVNLTPVDQWSFGDGTPDFNGDAVSHTYNQPGLYTAVFSTSCNLNVASQSFIINDEAPITPGIFDAVETGANPGTPIYTKIAGKNFSLDVLATHTDGTLNTSYRGTARVEIVNAMSSSTCANMTAIQQLGDTGFTPGNDRKTLSMTIPNSWQDLRLRMTELNRQGNPTGNQACSTDAFAVRPAFFVFTVTDSDWLNAGTTRTLNGTSATSGPTHKAGRPFTITATAYNGASSPQVTTNYQGSPTVVVKSIVLPSGCISCTTGSLTTPIFTGNNGTISTNQALYSEAGSISVELVDDNFATIDASDTPLSQREIPSSPVTIGRFVPDHFNVTLMQQPVLGPACGVFTYLDQPFGFSIPPIIDISAQNAFGQQVNDYTGNIWRLGDISESYAITGNPSGTGLDSTGATHSPSAALGSAGNVSITFSGPFLSTFRLLTRSPQPLSPVPIPAPFVPTLSLSFPVTDADGVAYVNPSNNSDVYTLTGMGFTPASANMRFGRLDLQSAVGSELLPLPVGMITQYWNGTGYQVNTDDSCSSVPTPATVIQATPLSPGLTFYPLTATNQLGSGDTSVVSNPPFISGSSNLLLSAPGAGHYGYLDIVTAAPLWLQANWDGIDRSGVGDFYAENPRARALFGVYKGNSRFIDYREIY